VVETITPGAAFADDLLETGRNNFLCAVLQTGDSLGTAAVDVSTGAFRLVLSALADGDAVLARFAPREVLVARGATLIGKDGPLHADEALVTERDAWEFDADVARDELVRHFRLHSLEGLGFPADAAPALGAAGALLRYVRDLQPSGVPHLMRPVLERTGQTMPLDEMTRRNLELVESLRAAPDATNGRAAAERSGTLLGVLDRTQTPMGARLLRQWLLAPLLDRGAIEARLEGVAALVNAPEARVTLRESLDGVRDVERLASKAAAGRATPRELRALGDSLCRLPDVARAARASAGNSMAGALGATLSEWDSCEELAAEVCGLLVERPPAAPGEGDAIVPGGDPVLDEL
jgi:DNA mismatch repair protein MutS